MTPELKQEMQRLYLEWSNSTDPAGHNSNKLRGDVFLAGAEFMHAELASENKKIIWLLHKIQGHGYSHYEDCTIAEDDSWCICGVSDIEKWIEQALVLLGEVKE